ncbi:hypothetical protein J2752_001963 [Halarchaeum rubridurum]|uniref:Uncharacterized protein n=1 Tax=Halarchaeum rubridurum TaxID=489911 RepID=A0A830G0H9_9EURY|nr:hypothetical protein [Halarchaeum rubridurum]MBP1955051.1 hypothetical protein [Halarchaeum rubridurum]GGM69354.1 hypothetical protein GCM10009017_19420 [Halarchaeum rubridurum]
MGAKKSKRANRYGTLAEKRMAEKWRLQRDGVHTFWRDAVDPRDGTPWELKAAVVETASGRPGRFRVREHAHAQLVEHDGRYGFAVYRRVGRGIKVLRYRALPADQLPVSAWYGSGGESDEHDHTKIALTDVF